MKFCKSALFDKLRMLPESVTVCATLDEAGEERVISDLMIRRACEQLDKEQQWPYGENLAEASECAGITRTATILQFPSRTDAG